MFANEGESIYGPSTTSPIAVFQLGRKIVLRSAQRQNGWDDVRADKTLNRHRADFAPLKDVASSEKVSRPFAT
jgi:hypothetical protein